MAQSSINLLIGVSSLFSKLIWLRLKKCLLIFQGRRTLHSSSSALSVIKFEPVAALLQYKHLSTVVDTNISKQTRDCSFKGRHVECPQNRAIPPNVIVTCE